MKGSFLKQLVLFHFLKITPVDKLQEPNWDSIVHNVWQRKNKFHQIYLGAIAIVPTESRNPFEEIEEKKEGS